MTEPANNKIKYLDGIRFKRVIHAAANRLIERQGHLNDINVFPVPDGDTGSNMAGTMQNVVSGSSQAKQESINDMSRVIADSALEGARGNSGVILAQFFSGFAEAVKDVKRITPSDFINAATHAKERAFESIANPQEGTILSVIRAWSDHLVQNKDKYKDFQTLLYDSLQNARSSVQDTKEKLASLKAADVVDAGGLGFLYLLEGIVEFTEHGKISPHKRGEADDADGSEKSADTSASTANEEDLTHQHGAAQRRVAVEELTFRYCTQCMVRGENIDVTALRKAIANLGDSQVVAGGSTLARVHIHSNEPEKVYEVVATFGNVEGRKVDDMLAQHQAILAGTTQTVGIATDSTCDVPEELLQKLGVRVVPMRLTLDDEEFIDKVTMAPAEFNERLGKSKSARTSQPAPSDFTHVYGDLGKMYDDIVALHVVGQYSGTLQSAQNTAKQTEKPVCVVNTQACSAALGLLVVEAAKRAQAGMRAADIVEHAHRDMQNLHFLVAMDTLDFAVRGGRLSRGAGSIAKLLNIKPILEFDSRDAGTVKVCTGGFGRRMAEFKIMHQIMKRAKNRKNIRIAIVHVAAQKSAEHFASLVRNSLGIEPEFIVEASPVLGIHSGPKACAIAMLTD